MWMPGRIKSAVEENRGRKRGRKRVEERSGRGEKRSERRRPVASDRCGGTKKRERIIWMSNTTPRAPTHTAIQVPSTAALFDTAHCAGCHRFTLYRRTQVRVSRVRTYPHIVARAFPLIESSLFFISLSLPLCLSLSLHIIILFTTSKYTGFGLNHRKLYYNTSKAHDNEATARSSRLMPIPNRWWLLFRRERERTAANDEEIGKDFVFFPHFPYFLLLTKTTLQNRLVTVKQRIYNCKNFSNLYRIGVSKPK